MGSRLSPLAGPNLKKQMEQQVPLELNNRRKDIEVGGGRRRCVGSVGVGGSVSVGGKLRVRGECVRGKCMCEWECV